MDRIVEKVFKNEHVKIIELEMPDLNFPTRISGISCMHCGKKYERDADFMINHLQSQHNLLLHDILFI
jgi:hypothetical protein